MQVIPFGYELSRKGYWTVILAFFIMKVQEISGTTSYSAEIVDPETRTQEKGE